MDLVIFLNNIDRVDSVVLISNSIDRHNNQSGPKFGFETENVNMKQFSFYYAFNFLIQTSLCSTCGFISFWFSGWVGCGRGAEFHKIRNNDYLDNFPIYNVHQYHKQRLY